MNNLSLEDLHSFFMAIEDAYEKLCAKRDQIPGGPTSHPTDDTYHHDWLHVTGGTLHALVTSVAFAIQALAGLGYINLDTALQEQLSPELLSALRERRLALKIPLNSRYGLMKVLLRQEHDSIVPSK
jgi:hypothetical protein